MLSTLTGWRAPQDAQEGIHGVDGVDQAIRDADEGGVAQVRLAAERRLERAERGHRFGRLAGPERERQSAHRRAECRGECVQPLRSAVTGLAVARGPLAQRDERVQRERGMGQPAYRRYCGLSDRMGQGRVRGFVGQRGAGGDLEGAPGPGRSGGGGRAVGAARSRTRPAPRGVGRTSPARCRPPTSARRRRR